MKNRIAEVALPISIALNQEFDYLIPEDLDPPVSIGCRVLVPFRTKAILGYVTKLKKYSPFEKKLRPIAKNFDRIPILNAELLEIARKIQDNYFCSYADSIESVIPIGLKKLRRSLPESEATIAESRTLKLPLQESEPSIREFPQSRIVLIHDLSNQKRWDIYAALIKKTLNEKKSVIFLVPDHEKINPSLEFLKIDVQPYILSSRITSRESMAAWFAIKTSDYSFVIGTRSAVFAPANNLGLIIIEEEEHFAYRQDQVPHYRTQEIAFQKAGDSKAQVILGSFTPSLDSYFLCEQKKASYCKLERTIDWAHGRIIDMRDEFRFKGRQKVISKILEHRIVESLDKKEKLLIFIPQKAFSTFLFCQKCKKIQTCPRCSSSLRYHFKEKSVSCPTCQFKIDAYEICPQCKSAYVKYFGFGLEKVESEIVRLFPSVRISTYEKGNALAGEYDIMLASHQFLEDPYLRRYSFDSVYVLSCEQILGHVDFRSTEKAFARLLKLLSLAKKEICVQTQVVENAALKFLVSHDVEGFWHHELEERKELDLAPVTQVGILTVRSKNQSKALRSAQNFYNRIKKPETQKKSVVFCEPVPCIPLKVRGNFRYQILVKFKKLDSIRKIIKQMIGQRESDTIVTFDPSPL